MEGKDITIPTAVRWSSKIRESCYTFQRPWSSKVEGVTFIICKVIYTKVERVGMHFSCLHAQCGLVIAAEAALWCRWMKNSASPSLTSLDECMQARIRRAHLFYLTRWLCINCQNNWDTSWRRITIGPIEAFTSSTWQKISMSGLFLKNEPFSFIFGLFKQTINFNNKSMWKNVHPVYCAGITTHNFLNMSLHPLPLAQGSRPNSRTFNHCNLMQKLTMKIAQTNSLLTTKRS